jgi:putative ABC transport system permease protein
MLRTYFLVALRQIQRGRLHTGIHVAGLAVSLCCCTLLLFYVRNELAVNTLFPEADRLHRVDSAWEQEGMGLPITAPAPVSATMARELPEVASFARTYLASAVVHAEAEPLAVDLMIADAGVLAFLGLPLAAGDAATALARPRTAAITAQTARRVFGTEAALGQALELETWSAGRQPFEVTAVLADPPFNSITHLHSDDGPYDVVISPEPYGDFLPEDAWNAWDSRYIVHYVRLAPGATREAAQAQLDGFAERYAPEALHGMVRFTLNPVRTLHLTDNDGAGWRAVTVLSGLAVLILLIAGLNVTLLATASSASRAREVGVRKALGGSPLHVAGLSLTEGLVVAGLAAALGGALAEALAGPFFALVDREVVLAARWDRVTVGLLAGAAMTAGVLSSAYPAAVLAQFRPVRALAGQVAGYGPGALLSRGIVVVQFTVALVFVAGALTVQRQVSHLLERPLGFDREHVLVLPGLPRDWSEGGYGRIETARQRMEALPGVRRASVSWQYPGTGDLPGNTLNVTRPDGSLPMSLPFFRVDEAYAETYGLETVAGDFVRADAPPNRIALNESAVRALGWATPEEAVGQTLVLGEGSVEIGGVVRDFHHQTLRQPIRPVAFVPIGQPPLYRMMSLRLEAGTGTAALPAVRAAWAELFPDAPFRSLFLDEAVRQVYAAERRFRTVAGLASALAVLVACLGLFGLAALAAARRRREIGIRKTLGASTEGLVALVAGDFLRPVALAAVLAAPVAYWAMGRWLEGFAHRITLGPGVFLLTAVLALTIALATVGYHTFRAATADPVNALRSE